jgi:hypothetical protein
MTPGVSKTCAVECERCGKDENTSVVSTVSDQALKDFLNCGFYKALCKGCLTHFKSLLAKADAHSIDNIGSKLEEGKHYYMESGFMVFTELYHVAKGYCCQSGCRHCAYGYKVEI